MNESLIELEIKIAARLSNRQCECENIKDCPISREWKDEISKILQAAEYAWPGAANVSNQEAIDIKSELYALFEEYDSYPELGVIESVLERFRHKVPDENSNDFRRIINDIETIIKFPVEISNAMTAINKVDSQTGRFSDVRRQVLGIEQLRTFPNDDIYIRYSKNLADLMAHLHKKERVLYTMTTEEDNQERQKFIIEFRKNLQLFKFAKQYNKVATGFRLLQEQPSFDKLLAVLDIVGSLNPDVSKIKRDSLEEAKALIDFNMDKMKDIRSSSNFVERVNSIVTALSKLDSSQPDPTSWHSIKQDMHQLIQIDGLMKFSSFSLTSSNVDPYSSKLPDEIWKEIKLHITFYEEILAL